MCGLQARAVLMGQWGFGKNGDLAGTVCLFTGEPGTGKTLAAEAVGFETGKPLKVRHIVSVSPSPGPVPAPEYGPCDLPLRA